MYSMETGGPEPGKVSPDEEPARGQESAARGGPERAPAPEPAPETETRRMPAASGPPPGTPPVPPGGVPAGRAGRNANWTAIALIIVSVLAVLLLATTIALAIHVHQNEKGWEPRRLQRFRDRPRGPMREFPPWREPGGQQSQPQQSSPESGEGQPAP